MAPTTTTQSFSSADSANNLAAFTSLPSSISSVHIALSQQSQNTSPKQFIPVGVLTVFLVLFFLSHLMRYPRILYVSRELHSDHSRSIQDHLCPNQQNRRTAHEKESDVRATSFPRPSFSGSKRLSSFDPHTEAIYSEPTVRLVQSFHNYSLEPRVYLPEEISVPSPSQTLVDSPRSDSSISNVNHQSLPPRVYLPPTLPETAELGLSHHQGDGLYTNNVSSPYSNLQRMPSSNHHLSGLSTSFPCSSTETITTSSDVLILPFIQDQLQAITTSVNSTVEDTEIGGSRLACSPELSSPPLAHAHPILVRRALSPWRRRLSLESSYDAFFQTNTDVTSASTHPHRPSVPSRLRYFIARSVTASLSGSLRTRSTTASSLCQRSEISEPSRPCSHSDGTVLFRSRLEDEKAVVRFSEDLLNASAKMSELGKISDRQRESSSFAYKSPAQAGHFHQCRVSDHCRQSVSEVAQRHSHTASIICINAEKDIARGIQGEPSSHPFPKIPGLARGVRSSVNLGLDPVFEPGSTNCRAHRIPVSSASSQGSESACNQDTEPHKHGSREFGREVPSRHHRAYGSLRTVPSRWMCLSPTSDGAHTLTEETRLSSLRGSGIPDDMPPEDSVEIMVVGRSEGLEGV